MKIENERRAKEIIELGGTAKKYEFELQFMKSSSDARKNVNVVPSVLSQSPVRASRKSPSVALGESAYDTNSDESSPVWML